MDVRCRGLVVLFTGMIRTELPGKEGTRKGGELDRAGPQVTMFACLEKSRGDEKRAN